MMLKGNVQFLIFMSQVFAVLGMDKLQTDVRKYQGALMAESTKTTRRSQWKPTSRSVCNLT